MDRIGSVGVASPWFWWRSSLTPSEWVRKKTKQRRKRSRLLERLTSLQIHSGAELIKRRPWPPSLRRTTDGWSSFPPVIVTNQTNNRKSRTKRKPKTNEDGWSDFFFFFFWKLNGWRWKDWMDALKKRRKKRREVGGRKAHFPKTISCFDLGSMLCCCCVVGCCFRFCFYLSAERNEKQKGVFYNVAWIKYSGFKNEFIFFFFSLFSLFSFWVLI